METRLGLCEVLLLPQGGLVTWAGGSKGTPQGRCALLMPSTGRTISALGSPRDQGEAVGLCPARTACDNAWCLWAAGSAAQQEGLDGTGPSEWRRDLGGWGLLRGGGSDLLVGKGRDSRKKEV